MEAQDELGFLLTASDINLDGQTDAEDLRIIGVNWQRKAVGWSQGDLNADGVVNAIDLNLVGIDWPTVMPKPVPETAPPLIVWLLGFALRVRSGFSRGTAICQSRE